MSLNNSECHCVNYPGKGLDISTPRNEHLTAFFKRSYANHTVKERMPIIITKIIDNLVRNKEQTLLKYGQESGEDLKFIIGELSKLKYEIQTNKEIVKLTSKQPDAKHYNNIIKYQHDKNETCNYFNVLWLFAECYMYRRIWQMFEETTLLNKFDPFMEDKHLSFDNGVKGMISVGQYLLDLFDNRFSDDCKDFVRLLAMCLWSNKTDLSHSNGNQNSSDSMLLENLYELSNNIISDMSLEIWSAVNIKTRFETIDIVLDNCGFELFTDMCFADYLIEKRLAERVRFYVKSIPWFLSDVTRKDFDWLVDHCADNEDEVLKKLGLRWRGYLDDDFWTIEEHDFWTTPLLFKHMKKVDENLYRKLTRAKLIVFKGDLNYRKLFGEKFWDPTTLIKDGLDGFSPSRICILRTLKSEVVCGLNCYVVEATEKKDTEWMSSGNFGVIQYYGDTFFRNNAQ